MNSTSTSSRGYAASLRASAGAGSLAGLLHGLVDGVVAWFHAPFGLPWHHAPACLAGAVLVYGIVHTLGQLLLSPASHLLLRGRSGGARLRLLFGWGLGLALALELYWWSRPFAFYGQPFDSPGRLGAALLALVLGLALGHLFARAYARRVRPQLQRAIGLSIPMLWVVGGLYLLGQGNALARSGRGDLNERNRELPNVLLIVVDALRQDALGCYGDTSVKTPVIDALAERGVRFENAFVQAPFTLSSFGSWLTGKYPRRHGLVKMVTGIHATNVTLAWHLKGARFVAGGAAAEAGHASLQERDYVGASFLTGMMSHGSGLLRGADVYCEAVAGHGIVSRDSPWSSFSSELLLSILRTRARKQANDYSLAAGLAEDWFEENAERRFVALVHLYSTHTPYDPPQQFRQPYTDPEYDGPIQPGFYSHHRQAIESGEYPRGPEQEARWPADQGHIRALYRAGVAQADADIGRILDVLERKAVLDDTLVIVTSDHGEDLGDDGRWEHNHMYETNLRVPWVMSLPGRLPAGLSVAAPVDSIDLVPTICDLLGVSAPDDSERDGQYGSIDGQSLLPLLRGERDRVRAHSFAENGRFLSVSDGSHKLILSPSMLSEEGWARVIRGEHERAPRLFDLVADPAERENLWGREGQDARVAELYAALVAHDQSMPIARNQIVRSHRDEEAEDLTNQLGYGGETFEEDPGPGSPEEGSERP